MRGVFLTLLLALGPILSANTYYVAPNGNDSNQGTISNPWRTWGKAFNATVIQPGDTVFFRGGVYFKSLPNEINANPGWFHADDVGYRITRGGTAERYIYYFAFPGEEPILDCDNVRAARTLNTGINGGAAFTHFKGLTIRNIWQEDPDDQAIGWRGMASNSIVENCTIYNTHGIGFQPWGDHSNLQFINCDAYNHCDSLSEGNPGNRGTGFGVVNDSGNTGSIIHKGCRAWNCADQGFSSFSLAYMEYDNCWSFNNGQLLGGGHGFKLGFAPATGTRASLLRKVVKCIAAYNRHWGFNTNDLNLRSVSMVLYNNTAYKTQMWEGFRFANTAESDTEELKRVARNNISFDNAGGPVGGDGQYTHSHNSWDGGANITSEDFISLGGTDAQNIALLSGKRNPDGSLPDLNGFLQLKSTSDGIDAGIDVLLPYVGSAPDLGCLECEGSITEPSIPYYVSAMIENSSPSTLTITYNLTLANIVPAASAFTVRVNSTARSVTAVAISGTRVILTLASPVVYGDAVTVAYTKPATNPLQTSAGGQAASLTTQNVTNNVAAVVPAYVSAVVENASPSTLTITYNLTLANIVPAASAFTVRVNSTARSVTAVAVSGTRVNLTLASPVVYGDAVTVAYTKPATNPLQTSAGGQAASLTTQNVTNNVAAVVPAYVSAVVENASPSTLTITYNLTLANIVPAASAFTVRVNSTARSVTAVAISGTRVILTLASPVVYGDAVTVAYTKPATNPLQTSAGGQAASLTTQNVTNNVESIANQPPIVTISSPTKSNAFYAPATITIDAVASDPDGVVTKVEFFNGTVKLGEIPVAPYSFVWKDIPEGTYSIKAVATDNSNASKTSEAVTVVVEKSGSAINMAPVVTISSPKKNYKAKKNDKVVLIAEAYDPDGIIANVEFKSGGVVLGEDDTAPYEFVWVAQDTGTFVVTATALDNLGVTSAPAEIEIMVDPDFQANSENITLYPNPNYGTFSIDIEFAIPEESNTFSIFSMNGNKVYEEASTNRVQTKEFNLPDIMPGTYVLMVTSGRNIVATKKFIKR